MKKLLTEPLLHFFVLGAAIFLGYSYLGDEVRDTTGRIVVSAGKVENLAALFERTWQRPPTNDELKALVDDHVREEILYREGLAMGLDEDDTVIRRRVRQKVDFIIEDMMAEPDPGDEVLGKYLVENADGFRVSPRFTFRHIYFSPERRGDAVFEDADAVLEQLADGDGGDTAELGDAIMLEHGYTDLSQENVARLFGSRFAEQLAAIAPDRWTGPLQSGFGFHLVRVDQRVEGRVPELAEVRDTVLREWDNDRRTAAREQFFEKLLDRYEVVIEPPPGNVAGTAEAAQ